MMTVIPQTKEVFMAPPQYTPKDLALQSFHPPPDFTFQLQHAQAGCAACLEHLMAQNDPLVHWVIQHFGSDVLSYDEALQAGRIGLWQALLHFDPTRGVTLASYAVVAIGRRIHREGHYERRFWRPLPFLPPEPPPDPVAAALERLTCQAVPRWVGTLPPQLQFVVRGYYGLDGAPPQILPALGQRLGCSKQRVHQLLLEALHWLALPRFSWEVRLLLERTAERELRAALQAWAAARRRRCWRRWRPYP
jgi:RNA polymerase sigma factor (sigma-70 family)